MTREANPRTACVRSPGARLPFSAMNLAATLPEYSARMVAAVPQERRAWKRRRKTRARREDLAARGRRSDGANERRVREREDLNWGSLEEGEREEEKKQMKEERRETRKEKGKREKDGEEERRKGRRE